MPQGDSRGLNFEARAVPHPSRKPPLASLNFEFFERSDLMDALRQQRKLGGV